MTAPDPEDRATALREEAAFHEALADALVDLREEIQSEPVRETRLAGLYEEASTSDANIWNTVTAFVDLEDGEAVVTEESKLAAGKWAPEIVEDTDAMVTVDVQRGYTPEAFASIVSERLDARIEEAREDAADARSELAEIEGEADGG